MNNKLKNIPKQYIIFSLLFLIFLITVAVPTLSRFYNGLNYSIGLNIWDGSIGTNYTSGTGTKEDPYIISSGSEFAYFGEMLKTTTYENTYFMIKEDIILNEGFFIYEETNIKYILDDKEYYVKEYTNELYEDKELTIPSEVTLNLFNQITEFKGHLDGNFHSIYGLYITSQDNKEIALFNKQSGTLNNIYIQNMMIYGGINAAGIVNNAEDLELKNIYTNGYVIANSNLDNQETINYEDIHFTTSELGNSIYIDKEAIEKEPISSSIKGNYLVSTVESLDYELKINNIPILLGEFNVDLGQTKLKDILISTSGDLTPRNVSLINLEYEAVYKISSSSGIANKTNNLKITNYVNDINIYNEHSATGFINEVNGLVEIKNSYNSGEINGKLNSTGIIEKINNGNATINNIYNNGNLNGINNYGLINEMYGENIIINNSFNATNSKTIGSSNAVFTNVYSYYQEDNLMILEQLNKEFYNSLNFEEYKNKSTIEENVWIIEETKLPELYFIDGLNLIDLRTTDEYWNNYTYEVKDTFYNKSISLSVTSSAFIYSLNTVEYYVKNDNIPHTEEELLNITWSNYEKPIVLEEEGKYIVYIKLTDYNNQIRYINSDIINIDKTLPNASMSFNNETWTKYRTDISEMNIKENSDFTITGSDEESGIGEINYYLSNEILSEEELSELHDANWNEYDTSFSIPSVGNNIMYAKIEDNSGNIAYLNSDIITFEGYHMNYIKAGKNDMFGTDETINITDESSITINYIYNVPHYEEPEINHVLKLSQKLPHGTIVILSDNVNNKKYDYKVNEENIDLVNIPFSSFNLVGTVDTYFTESNYSDGINIVENFTITFDFLSSAIGNDILNFSSWIEVLNNGQITVRETIPLSIKPFNIYSNRRADVFINSSNSDIKINFNEDSVTNVNINTGINYQQASGINIYDSYIEEQDIILQLEITENNVPIDRDKLSNFAFKMNEEIYYPNDLGIVTITPNTGIQGINNNIEIYAYKGDKFIAKGTYALNVKSYVSYNEYENGYISNITIPLIVGEYDNISNILFKAELIGDQIIDKNLEEKTLSIESIITGSTEASLKVSLYKKTNYNAIDQEYTLININDYLINQLTPTEIENVYNGTIGNFDLIFKPNEMEKQSYKIVLEVYENNIVVGKSEKYFIIK